MTEPSGMSGGGERSDHTGSASPPDIPTPLQRAPESSAPAGDPDFEASTAGKPADSGFEEDEVGDRLAGVVGTILLPFRGAAAVWSFVVRRFESLFAVRDAFAEARLIQSPDRRSADLLQAAPAIALVVAVAAGSTAAVVQRTSLAANYRAIAAEAIEQEDHAAVRVYSGRAYDLDGDAELLYRVATAHDRLGDSAKAEREMRRLAGRRGYGPAHLWLAERLFDDPATFRDSKRLAEVLERLRDAEAAGADPAKVARRMAKGLSASGDLAAALPYLKRAAKDDPSFGVELATAYVRLGRPAEARTTVTEAEGKLRRRVEELPSDVDARARWVTCLLNLGRSQEALAGLDAAPKEGVLGDLFVIACLARERELATAGASAAERLALVRDALEVRPRSEAALLRLVELSGDASASEIAADAGRLLTDSVASGRPPAAVSLALGMRDWKAGDPEKAFARFEEAYATDPSNLVAANNVAWLLAQRTPPDLERALGIADGLVKRQPDSAQFRDTRGQVLAKLGRWDEALVDLERALAGMRGSVETRRALAEAYRRAGRESLAALQDREADRLEGKAGDTDGASR